MTTRLGITVPFLAHDLRSSCELARRAEDLGYTDAWSAEVSGPDGFATAAAVGIATERIRTGVAIVPVFSRPPALTAMGALAAQQASAGRFCLGIGASTPTIVEGWMGVPFERPLARIRETVELVRAAFAGEKLDRSEGTVTSKGFRLEAPPETPIPIFIAALGPKMLAMAAEIADGIALFLAAEPGIERAAAAAPDKELVARVICCPDEDVDQVRAMGRWILAPYLAAPPYNRFVAEQGHEASAREFARLWSEGDRKGALDAMSVELIDDMVLSGPAEKCKERLDSMRSAGLSTPILMLVSQQGPEAIRKAFESLAP
jgi:probable F420-dependent oxidoreductase